MHNSIQNHNFPTLPDPPCKKVPKSTPMPQKMPFPVQNIQVSGLKGALVFYACRLLFILETLCSHPLVVWLIDLVSSESS